MPLVTLITPSQPAGNPRLVRNADSLVDAGYDVRVVGVRLVRRWAAYEPDLLRGRRWRYAYIDLLDGPRARLRWHLARLRRRVSLGLVDIFGVTALDARAYSYVIPELTRLAAAEPASLYIAQQHAALPAAVQAARRTNAHYAFDAEDLLADCPDEPVRIVRRIERTYVGGAAFVSTMSEAAALHLRKAHGLSSVPLTLHNTASIAEGGEVPFPVARELGTPASIYWFGQTLGPHSCADHLLRALPLLCGPVRLVLRGNLASGYGEHLLRLAQWLGVSEQLELLPPAPPGDMVRLAASHDILFASQPGQDDFHQLAIGNKLFTGMMAGLALAATDTVAHRRFFGGIPTQCGFLVSHEPAILAQQMNAVLSEPGLLLRFRQAAWTLAREYFNWEAESRKLLAAVDQGLSANRRSGS